jgi:hypothetical protein
MLSSYIEQSKDLFVQMQKTCEAGALDVHSFRVSQEVEQRWPSRLASPPQSRGAIRA